MVDLRLHKKPLTRFPRIKIHMEYLNDNEFTPELLAYFICMNNYRKNWPIRKILHRYNISTNIKMLYKARKEYKIEKLIKVRLSNASRDKYILVPMEIVSNIELSFGLKRLLIQLKYWEKWYKHPSLFIKRFKKNKVLFFRNFKKLKELGYIQVTSEVLIVSWNPIESSEVIKFREISAV